MLRAIIDGAKNFSSAEVARTYRLGNANTIARNKRTLQDKDIIEQEGDHFTFVDPIFQLWLTREWQ